MKKIGNKIVGFKVKSEEEKQAQNAVVEAPAEPVVMPDDDPLLKRIENRPVGSLSAVSEKIEYNTQEGKKAVYVIVSFIEVDGVIEGQPCTIERPIEFFFPIGQTSSEHQWISSTMRVISLAARGGYAAQALEDMCKVAWDKGPVRCGVNEWGKPLYHNSEVAAIAWAIQQMLYRRGFLDVDGNQVPAKVLARRFAKERGGMAVPSPDEYLPSDEVEDQVVDDAPTFGEQSVGAAKVNTVGDCPDCGEGLIRMDGCPTCPACAWSKC